MKKNLPYKAVEDLIEKRYDRLKLNALDSIKYGEFCFNNYLMFEYFSQSVSQDSASYYLNRLMQFTQGVKFYN